MRLNIVTSNASSKIPVIEGDDALTAGVSGSVGGSGSEGGAGGLVAGIVAGGGVGSPGAGESTISPSIVTLTLRDVRLSSLSRAEFPAVSRL